MKRLRRAYALLSPCLPHPPPAPAAAMRFAGDADDAPGLRGRAGAWVLGLAVGVVAIGTAAAVAWRATPPASLDHAGLPASAPGTIKPSPTRTLAFDGSTGMIAIDRGAIEALREGDYVFATYGSAMFAWRVERRERRDSHLFVGLSGIDPATGRSTSSHASYHLYPDAVSHAVDTPDLAFEVYGWIGAQIGFVNLHRSPSRRERRGLPARTHAAP